MKHKLMNSPLSFGLGNLAIMLPSTAFSFTYTYYYVDKLGLPLYMFALARLIYVIWDLAIQPLSGYLSDRTRTRWGRRKPWIVGGMPFFALFFILVFSVPGLSPGWGLFAWFLAFQLLFESAMAVISVNYLSLFPEIFTDQTKRARASAVQQVFYIIALMIGTVATPVLYGSMGYSKMSIIYSFVFIALMVPCILGVREDPAASVTKPLGLKEAFAATLSNRPFWWFNVSVLFSAAVLGMVSQSIIFYAKYVLMISDSAVSILMMATFVSVIPLAFAWYLIVKRLGALASYKVSVIVFAVSVIPLLFARNLITGIIAGVILSVGLSGHFVIPQLVQSQIIDVDAQATGRRREGMYMAVSNFVVRSSALVTAFSFWAVSAVTNYESADHPGPHALLTFVVLMSVIPLGLLVISFICAMKVKNADVTISEKEPVAAG